MSAEDRRKWSSDVLFIGTWFPERGPFMSTLAQEGIALSIWGDRWQKAPEWGILKQYWRGPAVYGDDYARAIQGSKICLGLLSKGNRDLHTTRSVEIPSLGAVFCAERTSEHMAMYKDGEEAIFFTDARDCAKVCGSLLQDEALRESIARGGRLRFLRNGFTNEKTCASILESALAAKREVTGTAPMAEVLR
jgi:hypothetical protein